MGKKEIVDLLVEGGKASAGPAVGSALGPMGINIGQVLQEVNEKTKDFKGMKVPVKLIIDTETKKYEIEIGTPPASELIKNEIGLKSGAGDHKRCEAGVIAVEQLIKIAKMKSSSILVNDLKAGVKTMIGSCVSLGLLVDGKKPAEIIKEINEGKYDDMIKNEVTQVSEEKQKEFAELTKKIEEKKKKITKEKEAAKAAEEAKLAKKTEKVAAETTKAAATPAAADSKKKK